MAMIEKCLAKLTGLLTLAFRHDGLKKYGANTAWLFAEKFFRLVIGFSVGIYVARQLGPADFGVLQYALGFVALFSVLVELGLDSVVVRELINTPEKKNDLLGTAFSLKLGGFAVMLATLGVVLLFFGRDLRVNYLIWIIAAGYLFQSLQVIDFYFQAKVQSKYIAISQITALLLCSTGRWFLAWQHYPLAYLAGMEAMFMLLSALGYLFFFSRTGLSVCAWRFNGTQARMLLNNSWPLAVSSIAISFQMQIDQVMLGWFCSFDAVGNYAAALRIIMLWYFIPVVVGGSLFPAILSARQLSTRLYHIRLRRLFAFMVWCGILIAALMSIGSGFIIDVTYGAAYRNSALIMAIYSWCIVLVFFGSMRGRWMIAENQSRTLLWCSLTGAVCNIGLNFILIPYYGGVGSAVAALGSFFITFLVMPGFFRNGKINTMLFINSVFRFWKYLK